MKERFSERYGYRAKHVNLIYEDAPEQARQGLREVVAKCGYDRPSLQRRLICAALRVRPDPNRWSESPINSEVDDLLHGSNWYEFYDLCEKLAKSLPGPEFEEGLNTLFREEGVGYRMTGGQIEKVGSDEFDKAVAQAAEQLGDPRFEVPLRQFKKALAFRNSMPPDHPNAVKEAVNAAEGVLQVVAKMPGTALPTILSNLNPPLPSGLRRLYDGLYGYGSGSEGARHASVGGSKSGREEAEFIIHTAAAAISYAIGTYG